MVTVLYRCPNTGFRVQGYTAEEESADHDGHVPVTCLACKLMHLVNPKTGEVLAETRPPTEWQSARPILLTLPRSHVQRPGKLILMSVLGYSPERPLRGHADVCPATR